MFTRASARPIPLHLQFPTSNRIASAEWWPFSARQRTAARLPGGQRRRSLLFPSFSAPPPPLAVMATADAATPAQVLQTTRFAERLAEIELRVPTALALAKSESSLAKRNQVRRKLYHDSELLRVELEEEMNARGIEAQWGTAPEIKEANAKLDAVRKQLRLEICPASKSPFELVYMIARLATMVLLLVGWFSAITVLIPLKLLNPLLAQLGVKKNYFPMDVLSVRGWLLLMMRFGCARTYPWWCAVEHGQPAVHCRVRRLYSGRHG